MPKLPLKFSPLKLLRSLVKDQKPRFEQLMDEAPQTPEYYSESGVKRLLAPRPAKTAIVGDIEYGMEDTLRGDHNHISVVNGDFPFLELSDPLYSDVVRSHRDHIDALVQDILSRGLRNPPTLHLEPSYLAGKPVVVAHDGRHRFLALSQAGMEDIPINISSMSDDYGKLDKMMGKSKSLYDNYGNVRRNAKIKPFASGGSVTSPLRQYYQYAEGGSTKDMTPGIYPSDNPITASHWMDEKLLDTPLGDASDWLYKKLGLTLGELVLDPVDQFVNRPMSGIRQSLVQGSVKPFFNDALDDVGETAAEYAVMNEAGEMAIGAAKKGLKAGAKYARKGLRSTAEAAKRLGRLIQDHVQVHEEPVTAP